MPKPKISTFEVILLIVGIAVAFLGFIIINQIYKVDNQIGWLTVIAIFDWLTLLVLFIALSLAVDTSRKQLEEIKNLVQELKHSRRKLI